MSWLWTHPFEGWGLVFDAALAAVVLAVALWQKS